MKVRRACGLVVRDESGMAMGLVVIMVVLIGLMGAGLLTFVSADLRQVVEVNRGQEALQAADAGVQAARQQILNETAARIRYDGGPDDSPWSYCYGISGCSTGAPAATGAAGVTLTTDTGTARVTIFMTSFSTATYRVISEGRSGNARRKVEAIVRNEFGVNFPRGYVTRNNLSITGNASPNNVSFFALGNAQTVGGSVALLGVDTYFGRWAATSGGGPYPNMTTGSFPNLYNATPRGTLTSATGIGALGTVTASVPTVAPGVRSYGSNTPPTCTVRNYSDTPTGAGCTSKIALPFRISTDAEDREYLQVLKNRALSQETNANPLFIDATPGNRTEDAGRANGAVDVGTIPWPSGADYQTVRYYKYASYNSANVVTMRNLTSDTCSSGTNNKGIIVVDNGDFILDGNRPFNGGVIVRAYSGGTSIPSQGRFTASGNPCLLGYANSGGDMTISGNIMAGDAPELGDQRAFRGLAEVLSWRELYQ